MLYLQAWENGGTINGRKSNKFRHAASEAGRNLNGDPAKKKIKKHKPKSKGDQRRRERLNSCLIYKAKKKEKRTTQ